MTRPRRALASLAVACALVPATASASTSDDEHVTWDQVRTALTAAHRLPPAHQSAPMPHPGAPSPPPSHPAPSPPSQPVPSTVPSPTARPTVPPTAGPTVAPADGATVTVAVTIPDLSWALDDPTASPAARRAACHQATGLDDETRAPLAACLAYVRRPTTGGPHP